MEGLDVLAREKRTKNDQDTHSINASGMDQSKQILIVD